MEFAFRHAWRDWNWSPAFPGVHATMDRIDLVSILRESTNRRRNHRAVWRCGKTYVPELLGDWELEEVAEALEDEVNVPLTGWTQLADAFLSKLGADQVQRQNSN